MGMVYSPIGSSVLPNGTLINNICHIYQDTKPTTRPNGSSLVARDVWYNTLTGMQGFWNGTYWLSTFSQYFFNNLNSIPGNGTVYSSSVTFPFAMDIDNSIFLEKLYYAGRTASNNSATVYWSVSIIKNDSNGTPSTLLTPAYNTSSLGANTDFAITTNLNLVITTIQSTASGTPTGSNFGIQVHPTNTPGSARHSVGCSYRLIL